MGKLLARILLTSVCIHLILSLIIGIDQQEIMAPDDGLILGLFISVIGVFYLAAEIPFVGGTFLLFRKFPSWKNRLWLTLPIVLSGTVIGNLLTCKVGGVRRPEEMMIFTVCGFMMGILACISAAITFRSISSTVLPEVRGYCGKKRD